MTASETILANLATPSGIVALRWSNRAAVPPCGRVEAWWRAPLLLVAAVLLAGSLRAQENGTGPLAVDVGAGAFSAQFPEAPTGAISPSRGVVWQAELSGEFTDADYRAALAPLLRAWELADGRTLSPGAHRRVGLKLYTASGPGLRTPMPLTRAVIAELLARGFRREELFLFGQSRQELQQCGYLPWAWTAEPTFDGVPVLSLDGGSPRGYRGAVVLEASGGQKLTAAEWFYESNVPSRDPVLRLGPASLSSSQAFRWSPPEDLESSGSVTGDGEPGEATTRRLSPSLSEEARRSYLPWPLLEGQVDFWINLPMGTDSGALGVAGALANASVWAVTNHERFLRSPASAPVAAAEIAAIPELLGTLRFSILSLERFQFIDEFRFNAHYTRQEPLLWLSASPAALDTLLWAKMVPLKAANRLPVPDGTPPVLIFAQSVGLGPAQVEDIEVIPAK